MKKRLMILITLSALLMLIAFVLLVLYTDNTGLVRSDYQISSTKLPPEFDGFRIAQIADLHNTEFGENNSDLLALLRESEPDIIVFTGDQVDARRTRLDIVIAFAKEAAQIAPCYLVTGNHEGSITQIAQLKTGLTEAGVMILDDEALQLQHNGAALTLIGLQDPTMNSRYISHGSAGAVDAALSDLTWDPQYYSILLAHHPEYLEIYAEHGVDLVLSGHAHGGQVRLGNMGIIAPHQGFFPKYDAGLYTMDSTDMILSRGLGNSLFPWRINNPPELVMVELITEQ